MSRQNRLEQTVDAVILASKVVMVSNLLAIKTNTKEAV
jgi:hypothetical protein